MTLARRTQFWRERLTPQSLVYDWFAAIHDVLSYQATGLIVVEPDVAQAKVFQQHGDSLEAHLNDFETLPESARKEVDDSLEALSRTSLAREFHIARLFGWLKLIDAQFYGLNISTPSSGSIAVLSARTRLIEAGTLSSSDVFGWVGPKAMSGERGKNVASFLHNLAYANCSAAAEVVHQTVYLSRGLPERQPLSVAVLPIVHDPAELHWEFNERTYVVSPSPDQIEAIADRTIAALDSILGKAQLVVMPELVSHREIEARVRAWLGEQAADTRPVALFCGSALIKADARLPRNEATLMWESGSNFVRQHKMNAYTFAPSHRSDVHIAGADENLSYVEGIDTAPYRVQVVDLVGVGRLVVMICEDLDRQDPWRTILKALGPNLCVVPVMNGSDWGWAKRDAEIVANETGTSLIVVNSGTLLPAGCSDSAMFARCYGPKLLNGEYWTLTCVDQDSAAEGPQWLLFRGLESQNWPLRYGVDV